MDWDEAMRRSEFRWTPGGLVQILVGVPHWESHRPRKATHKAQTKQTWLGRNKKAATVYVHGFWRVTTVMSAWLRGLQKRGPRSSIHIPNRTYSQTHKSGKYGFPGVGKSRAGCGSFLFVSAAALLKGQEAAAATALALTVFAVLGGGRC